MQGYFVDALAVASLRRRTDAYRAQCSKLDGGQRQLKLWKSADDELDESCLA